MTIEIKRLGDDYIEVDGAVYERMSSNSENVDLDLEQDVTAKLDQLVESGQFVSRGDCVRTLLRELINSEKIKTEESKTDSEE